MPPKPATGSARAARARGTAVWDAVGVLLFLALAATTGLAGSGERTAALAAIAGTAAALVVGRAAGAVHRAIPPLAVVAVGTIVAVGEGAAVIGTGPLGGAFGYENATGAFFAQVAFAGAMLVAAVRPAPLKAVGVLAAAGFGVIAAQASVAAAVTLATALIAVAVAIRPIWARPAVLVAGGGFLAVLATAIVLGATYQEGDRDGGMEGALRSALTERRVALWHDALVILLEHPGGVGPGGFDEAPSRLVRDADARWAHNAFLQQGSELGWAGLILTTLLFFWGFARLWSTPEPDAVVALGAAALAAFGVHASVDYVLHFPAVPLAAAALVGAAQAVSYRRSRDEHDEPRQEDVEGGTHPAGVGWPPAAG